MKRASSRPGAWDHTVADTVRNSVGAVGLDAINTMLVVADAQAKDQPLVFANGYFLEFTGYDEKDVIGQNCRFLQRRADGTMDDQQPGLRKVRHAIASGVFSRATVRNYRKDGVMFWNELFLTPVHDGDGVLRHIVGVQNDVSRHVQATHAERLVASVIDHNADAMLVVNADGNAGDGKIERANRAFYDMTGLRSGSLTRETHTSDVLPTCLGRSAYHQIRTRISHDGRFQGEVEIRGRRQTSTFAQYTVTPVVQVIKHGRPSVEQWCHIFRDVSERRRLEQDVLSIHSYEQQRIARDLHDGVAQDLAVAALSCSQLWTQVEDNNVKGVLHTIFSDIRDAAHQTRSIAHGLTPSNVKEQGLVGALASLARRTQDHGLARCEFHATAQTLVADADHEQHLYHIAREAVSNAIRHGQANRIWITLAIDRQTGTLTIDDDGKGLSQPGTDVTGIGLRTMRARARLLNGDIELVSSDRGGVRVRCRFPFVARLDADDREEVAPHRTTVHSAVPLESLDGKS